LTVDLPIPDVRPPNSPWRRINRSRRNIATMTFYYGDEKSLRHPIRDVTHRMDAKHDPNVETGTYGLFSNCCKNERRAIVEEGISTQFFCTSRGNPKGNERIRVLTGYYCPEWYCELEPNDYAIAAESIRFVSPGFVLNDIVSYLEGYPIDTFFRTWKHLYDEAVIRRLLLLLNTAPNATAEHITEIHNLETYALEQYGRMYSNRLNVFSWEYAGELMRNRGLV
jgi:hypothetical protein